MIYSLRYVLCITVSSVFVVNAFAGIACERVASVSMSITTIAA